MSDAVRTAVRPAAPPLVPQIRLRLASADTGLWDLAGGSYRSDHPPPFWAFAWAGGQALARYVLDHPQVVTGRRVLDLAAGSGLVAIAAARAGAAHVGAVDSDPAAGVAVSENARANGVAVTAWTADPLDGAPDADVVLAGDAFYTAAMAGRVHRFLRRAAAAGARVLVGDAQRGFLPTRHFTELRRYEVPVPMALEGVPSRVASVWELRRPER